ncbi:cholinesterase 2 [Nematostella vectensis]|uniref:cholinesterase 2 n=1 Tax=Nematostella vectensis TaxID=45351 RepID=UPI0013905C64|nr:cholinesterase 2 [Nematostella vectensis]
MAFACNIAWLLLVSLLQQVFSIEFAPVVDTTNGPVRGLTVTLPTGHAVRRYMGIPFAKAERFKAPVDPTPWTSTRDAFVNGKMCPQDLTEYMEQFTTNDMSEDCLNLDMFVPNNTAAGAMKSVMVWIYGGAFVSGANRLYDGSVISGEGDVIVVVVNYRVGIFGFLATGKNGVTGNYGMLDQVKSLQWVRGNINKFGGDAGKVTIFGESAGGASVGLLMLSPLANGLFRSAIPQSGNAAGHWVASEYSYAAKVASAFGKASGCTDLDNIVKCLEPKNFTQILDAAKAIPVIGDGHISPVIDGNFLPDSPITLLKEGKFNKVDVMIGTTNDDGTVFLPPSSPLFNISVGMPRIVFLQAGKALSLPTANQSNETTAAIIYRYTNWANVNDPAGNRRMYINMMTDAMFTAPAALSASGFLAKGCATYLYEFEHRGALGFDGHPIPSWQRAYHGAEIQFLFGMALVSNVTDPVEANFTRDVIQRWTNFAKSGNPNNPDQPSFAWPAYDAGSQHYLRLKPSPSSAQHLRADHMAFWNVLIPELIASERSTVVPPACPPRSGATHDVAPIRMVLLWFIILAFMLSK